MNIEIIFYGEKEVRQRLRLLIGKVTLANLVIHQSKSHGIIGT